MSKKIKLSELPEFDAAEHLPDDKAIAEYLAVVLEENNPSALAGALGTIRHRAARVRPSWCAPDRSAC